MVYDGISALVLSVDGQYTTVGQEEEGCRTRYGVIRLPLAMDTWRAVTTRQSHYTVTRSRHTALNGVISSAMTR